MELGVEHNMLSSSCTWVHQKKGVEERNGVQDRNVSLTLNLHEILTVAVKTDT